MRRIWHEREEGEEEGEEKDEVILVIIRRFLLAALTRCKQRLV